MRFRAGVANLYETENYSRLLSSPKSDFFDNNFLNNMKLHVSALII